MMLDMGSKEIRKAELAPDVRQRPPRGAFGKAPGACLSISGDRLAHVVIGPPVPFMNSLFLSPTQYRAPAIHQMNTTGASCANTG